MTNYKRGKHPNSQENLGKPKTKGGRKNLTLTQQSLDWLAAQKETGHLQEWVRTQ